MTEKKIINVRADHIQRGIDKYKGVVDLQLSKLLERSGYEYEVYRFADDRILLILPGRIAAFLYQNEAHLFHELALE